QRVRFAHLLLEKVQQRRAKLLPGRHAWRFPISGPETGQTPNQEDNKADALPLGLSFLRARSTLPNWQPARRDGPRFVNVRLNIPKSCVHRSGVVRCLLLGRGVADEVRWPRGAVAAGGRRRIRVFQRTGQLMTTVTDRREYTFQAEIKQLLH